MANIEAFDKQLSMLIKLINVLNNGDGMGTSATTTIAITLLAVERPDIIEDFAAFCRKKAGEMPHNEGIEGLMGAKLAIDTLIKAYDEGTLSVPGVEGVE